MTAAQTTTKHIGEHPLIQRLVNIADRADYVYQDEDALQDFFVSMLQRIPRLRNADWRTAVKYALLDARRRKAQMRADGTNYEDSPVESLSGDRRRDQLPGPIKPYDGPEPPCPASVETIPRHIVAARVIETEQARELGAYRYRMTSSECVVSAYCMPDSL